MPAPDALLFIAPGCPHCPVVLQGVSELVKEGVIGRLTVVNVAAHPEQAAEHGVRAAPWLRLGPFLLTGAQSPAQLRQWAERAAGEAGGSHYLEELFKAGELQQAENFIEADPARLSLLLEILANPDAAITIRLGATAVLEGYADTRPLQQLVPQLGELSRHKDHRVRADACHLLGLSGSPEARPWLEARRDDPSDEVREIAADSLAALPLVQ